ncbi:gluconate permease [Rhodococcus sp. BP-252]|uniref:GntP family permease n=1 Tax=unclassified Rhodococcus (in: high G+C Gram-positive bacteria) TaxID=192944 RepID=UPI00142F7538|nr:MULTISPECIES: SLC13 family permease [unclassified Rhodococcus (in: high G+C Gram-positive bacteria)]MBY6413129.1 gluconate permease [Rhodococcus sp. BP-320]MBY6417708.1 gluconate permease [Rhodococcus sp. BP-321]MBY6423268.1 gluconate permease [Rhodococcus sp. BP-324]MBY6427871.1 gluconate permease [Rhodococcus sp. BP-323]MBY6431870.1 gluconate permease [Rhodococcus sp. BP-322]
MSDMWIVIHTVIAVLAVVIFIVRFHFNPVVSLVLGAAYLGLATKLGVSTTVETITGGFGEIMAEVGLLIGFGVLMGAVLQEMKAIQRLVGTLLKTFGPKRLPYALSLTIATVLQSIFLDVLLVISAPLARNLAPKIGKLGTARMATALAIGLECGIVFMVPGVAALALAGLLGVPLGKMMIYGLILIVPVVIISIAVMTFAFRRGWWNEEKDEQEFISVAVEEDEDPADEPFVSGGVAQAVRAEKRTRLVVLLSPLLLALVLIATGALLEVAEISIPVVEFVASPVIALLIGLVGTCLVARYTVGQKRVEKALARGFAESGQILILTGVGGSLAAMIKEAGLGDILGQYFTASTAAPLLMVWVIAAALHIAVGSVTISAITSAGILAPVAPLIGLDPVFIALAAGAGSLFAVHVTSNTFWLLQSLMGQSTRGTLKTCSVGVSVASVVAILLILPMSLVL